jgi:NAD(P)-dependent dehydrogenase (short-subunit alcohol dehydrogenase family)
MAPDRPAALVTGSASGIGRAAALRLARAGYDVAINAGMTSQTPPDDLDGVDLAEWDRVFAVNVRGLFQVTRACAPMLRAAAW